MKKIASQGDGVIPALSRRHFIQASSALVALPFVSTSVRADAATPSVAENTPPEKVVQTCSTFDCAENVIFVRTLAMGSDPYFYPSG
ncbi:anaerobic dimethyl sulfoxide reductase subunit A [Enterobacter cancerogenus]|uniref:Anaerobic dimethyl sulfoxide reductase subunit A n=1 Tax=Enterobacter cancerogenus TaxID=69218 RepID=A0A484Z7W6_9ENTR|nr:anaerobic dimethyl sulfoxide reductase subunit A [Enterobacter cancerogenus]